MAKSKVHLTHAFTIKTLSHSPTPDTWTFKAYEEGYDLAIPVAKNTNVYKLLNPGIVTSETEDNDVVCYFLVY